ncbi:putative Hemagglutinin-neuraminidase [Prochlorococcus marinus str. MIT 9401]|uniref:Putative Hemagglutinin-neuraminidase n=2 Tax=Prochlorococcaceae TaxID=2881426 RepID=A0A0A2BC38_PROMR|nr:putative Hemagglutinin-neuraminidase [Prochlorococcus marinus str. MIT 9401]
MYRLSKSRRLLGLLRLKIKNSCFLKVNKFLLVFINFLKGVSTMELRFFPINVFRETPKVTFFDAGIDTSNGSDVVIHSGEAISPPDDLKDEQYYVHNHQIDHNLVITGERKFVLINPSWDEPHHVIYLNRRMGALEIPVGTYHRSISGKEGSIVLNQPKRDKFFDPAKEFIPQKLNKISLIKARKSLPVYWIYENNKIKRVCFNPLERKVKTLF